MSVLVWLVGVALAGDGGLPPSVTPPAARSAAAALPAPLEALDVPLDDMARLEGARRDLGDPDRRHAAMVALARLARAADPDVSVPARDALGVALLASPPSAAWTDVARLLAGAAPPEQAGAWLARVRVKPPALRAERAVPVPAAERAWKRAPRNGAAAWSVARARVERRPADALAPARVALAARPWDPARLEVLRRAAAAAGTPQEALAASRAVLRVARSPADRERIAQSLIWALGDVALTETLAGRPLAALDAHAEVLAFGASADALRGAAGAAWGAGRLDLAWNIHVALHAHVGVDRATALALGEIALATDLMHPERLRVAAAALVGAAPITADDASLAVTLARVERARASVDARRATVEGRHADALALWTDLDRTWLDSSEPGRGRANALSALGRHEDALLVWQELGARFLADPWVTLGTCHALLALGRADEARVLLAPLRALVAAPDADPALKRGVREVEGHALRRDSTRLVALGHLDAALLLAQEAIDTEPGAWSSITLGGVLLARGEFEQALAAYEAAAAVDPALADAAVGRAVSLGRLAREREGIALLDAQDAASPHPMLAPVRARLESDLALREGIALADAGQLDSAAVALAVSAALHPHRADLLSALASVQLRRGDAGAAFEAALQAVRREPGSEWATRSLVDAGRSAGRAREAAALLRAESRVPAALLDEASLDATLEQALGESALARARAIASAERLATTARMWDRVGEAWLDAGRPDRARVAYARAQATAPTDRDALRGELRALLAAGRFGEAWTHARSAERALADASGAPDPALRLGAAEARVRARRGDEVTALLDEVERSRDAAMAASARALRARSDAEAGARGSAAVAVVDRRGAVGTTGLRAVLTPVQAFVPASPILPGSRLGVQAWTITLQDDLPTDSGGSFALGWDTAPEARWSLSAHVGTSPVGFAADPYVVGAARVGFRPAPAWNLGWEVARAPRTDTRAAWVGTVFPETGQLYGRVSHVWTALEASGGGVGWDLGGVGRAGWVEGIGVAPNPMAEAVAWTGRTYGGTERFVRVGVDGIGMGYQRREDGLAPGQGGYFSPPFYGAVMARVSGARSSRAGGVCGGLAAGVRHQSPGENLFDTTGTGASVAGNVGAAWRVAGDWRVQADARGERASTGWQQVSGLLRLTNGGQGTSVSPSPSAIGAPGLGLPRVGELCDVLP